MDTQVTRLLDRERETLNQLTQEIARALGTAPVLTKHGQAIRAQFKNGEAMAADVDEGGGFLPEQKAVPPQHGLLGRGPRQIDLRGKASGDGSAICAGPSPIRQRVEQRLSWLLAVGQNFAPDKFDAILTPPQFHQLDRFRAGINSNKPRPLTILGALAEV
jgi:hypothetical protein